MAMFILEMAWLQVLVFMLQNLLSLLFLIVVMPYKLKANNYLNILNESTSLLVSYLITQINDSRYIEYQQTIGNFINYTLYFSWSCNFSIIAYFIIKETYLRIRKKYYHKFWNRFVCCRPKVEKSEEK